MDSNLIRSGLSNPVVGRAMAPLSGPESTQAEAIRMEQEVSPEELLKAAEEGHEHKVKKHRKSLKDRKEELVKRVSMGEGSGGGGGGMLPDNMLKKYLQQFIKRNSELQEKMLIALRDEIIRTEQGTNRDEILAKVRQFYEDPFLADEALDFLSETLSGDLKKEVVAARAELNDKFGREIASGRNIGAKALEFAAKGLGTPTTLRDLYRDITGNPRDATTLFTELSDRYKYKDLKDVIKFMFHSLGTDLKSKGPSIPRGLLFRLMTEARTLQAIMGVYRFFMARMRLVQRMFVKNGLTVPKELTFESMSKEFMALVKERYPTAEKAFDSAKRLGLEDWILAKIIVLSQIRDAVREVALHHIYQSVQHRDDLLLAILEALEDLEDQMEDEDEGDDDDDDDEEEGAAHDTIEKAS